MKEKGLLLVLTTAVISGVSVYINKFGVSTINPSVFTFAKNFVVAALILSVILLLKNFNELRNISRKNLYQLLAIGLFGGSIPFLLFFNGLAITTAAKGSIIQKTMFVFVAIFSVILLKEKLNRKLLAPFGLLLLGNAIFVGLPFSALNLGDLMIMLATVFWAGEIIISKSALRDMSPSTVIFGRMFFGALFISPFLFASGNANLLFALDNSQLIWIAITSLMLFGYVVTFYSGLRYVSAHVATSVLLLGSPITTILSLVSGETVITSGQVIGSILLISGVAILLSLDKLTEYANSLYRAKMRDGWN